MKKILIALGLVLFLLSPMVADAAGTVTIVPTSISVSGQKQRVILTITHTSDSSAVLSDATINPYTYGIYGMYLISSETLSGATAPTNGYVIAIKTASGGTLFTMTGSNSTTVSVLTDYQHVNPIYSNLTFSLSGNSVNSATGTCRLTFTTN